MSAESDHRRQRGSVVVFEWEASHSTMKSLWIITSSRFTTEVIDHVVIFVFGVKESTDFSSGVAIYVLKTSGRKSVNNDAVIHIN
jgi:hypothetical protein